MMWSLGPSYGWGMALFGAVMMLVFWGGIAVLAVYVVRAVAGPRHVATDGSIATLQRRLAAGEITPEEFERIRKLIQ